MKNILGTKFHLIIFKIVHRLLIKIKNYFNFRRAKNPGLSDKFEKVFLRNTGFFNCKNKISKYDFMSSILKETIRDKCWDNLIGFEEKNFIKENLENNQAIIDQAELYINHIFNLLGSGKVKVSYNLNPQGVEGNVYHSFLSEKEIKNSINKIEDKISGVFKNLEEDYYRLLQHGSYEPIDWHVDFKSGYRWNKKTWYKKVEFGNILGVDIKVPWELSRCYHFLTLGQAYFITKDEKYTREFIYQFIDWKENNPIQFGVNWVCTMDTAIRACNLILSFLYFKNSKLINKEFLYEFIKIIFFHGLHIKQNLEKDIFSTNTNHYLSNLTGLIYIGRFLNSIKFGKSILDFAINELVKESAYQINNDGSSFEASTSYHRLVLELLFYPIFFLVKSSKEFKGDNFNETAEKIFGKSYVKKVFDMFEVLKYCMKPDGSIPQIGDNDNGRLHIFEDTKVLDVSYLVQIACVFFNEKSFKILDLASSKQIKAKDEILWLFGKRGFEFFKSLDAVDMNSVNSNCYIDSGFFVMRKNNNFLMISAGVNGQGSNGGHAHNDKLSFELYLNGENLIVDTGTYLYTASKEWRNRFRSTEYHNTVSINDMEQNRFVEKSLFLLKNDSNVKINKWSTGKYLDLLDAEHYGFQKHKGPLIHQRQIGFDKKNIRIFIRDIIKGEGRHLFKVFFHLNNSINFEYDVKNSTILFKNLNGKDFKLVPVCKRELELELIEGWISPNYGEKVKGPVFKFFSNIDAPFESLFIIAEDNYDFHEEDVNSLLNYNEKF